MSEVLQGKKTSPPSVSSSDGHSSSSPQSSLVTSRPLRSPTITTVSSQGSSQSPNRTQPSGIVGSLGDTDDLEFHSASDTPKKSHSFDKRGSDTPSMQRLSWSTQQFLSRYRQKNIEMHKYFKELPETEKLIDDYSCALQREILAQGRMYVTQSYLCFYANIFTWETLLIIPLTRIQSMTKEKTAYVFPNAIQITTNSDKYTFSSFIQRDTSYQVIFRLWQNSLLNFPMPLTDLYMVARKSWGDPYKFNCEDDIWGTARGSSLSQSSSAKLEVMEKNTETQSYPSTTSLSNQTMSDEDPRRSTPMAMKTADTAPSSDTLRIPSSVEDTPIVRNRSKSASLVTSPSTSTTPIKSNQATVTQLSHVSSSVGDDSLNTTTTNSSCEPKNGEQQSVSPQQTSSGSLDMGNTGEGEGKRERVGEERRNTSGGLATVQPRVSTIVGDNDSQLSHPLLIIRDGPDLHSITESLLSSEFETTSIVDAGEVLCGCDDHDGCLVINNVFNVNVEVMFQMLFTDSEFMREFMKSRNVTNIEQGQWQDLADGSRVRDISYTVNLNYSFGPKYSPTTERQVYSKLGQLGMRHIVETEVCNGNIPYSDKFFTKVKVCMTRVTHNSTRLRVISNIAFRKTCWAVVKTLIERNAGDGIRTHYAKLEASLKEYIPTMSNRKKTSHKSSSLRSLKRKRSKKGSMSGRELDSMMGTHHRPGHSRNTSDISGNVSLHANTPLDPSRHTMISLRASQSDLISTHSANSPNFPASTPLLNKLSVWLLIFVAVLVLCNMGLYYWLMRHQTAVKPPPYSPYSSPPVDEWPSTEKDWRSLLDKMETSCNEKIQLYEGVLTEMLTAIREVEIRMGQVFDSTSKMLRDRLQAAKDSSSWKKAATSFENLSTSDGEEQAVKEPLTQKKTTSSENLSGSDRGKRKSEL